MIGLIETAPTEAKTTEELDEWAIQSLKYVRENNDAGSWGSHEGSYIEQMTKEGKLVIREQKGRYQDENPETTGELRTIQLE